MASVSNEGNGLRRIQFIHPDGRRTAIRLGKVSQRNAEAFSRRIEQLLECLRLKQPMDADLTQWVADLDDALAAKLAKGGLIRARVQACSTRLAAFIRRYIDGRNDVKPASKEIWRQGEKGLCDYFGSDTDIATITEGMAEDYLQHLVKAGLATATIKKRLDFGRQVFRSAVKHRLIPANPFIDVRIKVHLPNKRWFISLEDTMRLIDACPNEDWRIIIALCRFAGLRCPSEVLSLRWSDINWDPSEGEMHVQSPKTEHHPGKESRFVPIFSILRPHLERAFEAAPEGAVYVVNEAYRLKALGPDGWRSVNLRTPFERIIQRAGLKPWVRLFHNLRSSRETELHAENRFSANEICQWMGHSMRVAEKSYLMIRKEAVRKANAEVGPEAAQNPAQHPRASSGSERNWGTPSGPDSPLSTAQGTSPRNPAKPTSGEGGIRTRGPAFDRTRL
jgi:integrase